MEELTLEQKRARTYYSGNRNEIAIMSWCLAIGFRVYPVCEKRTSWSYVVLEVEYNGVKKRSVNPPFHQKYLAWELYQVYNKFYESVKHKL